MYSRRLKPRKILYWCPVCFWRVALDKLKTDYPEATMLEMECPDCSHGLPPETSVFYDKKGSFVLYDPADVGNAEHPIVKGLKD